MVAIMVTESVFQVCMVIWVVSSTNDWLVAKVVYLRSPIRISAKAPLYIDDSKPRLKKTWMVLKTNLCRKAFFSGLPCGFPEITNNPFLFKPQTTGLPGVWEPSDYHGDLYSRSIPLGLRLLLRSRPFPEFGGFEKVEFFGTLFQQNLWMRLVNMEIFVKIFQYGIAFCTHTLSLFF